MSVLVVAVTPGGSAEQDDAVAEALDFQNNPPAGVRVRAAGPSPEGWRIVSLWDSQQAFEAFRDERLLPGLERAGRPAPSFEIWPIERVRIL